MIRISELVDVHAELTAELVEEWIALGWVTPVSDPQGPVFTDFDAARVQLICEFRLDLGVEADTIPAILGLLDQLYDVRAQLRALLKAVHAQPAAVRRQIANRVAAELRLEDEMSQVVKEAKDRRGDA